MARYIKSHWAWIEQIDYHVKVRGWTDDVASHIALAKVQGGHMLELACREVQQFLGEPDISVGELAVMWNSSVAIYGVMVVGGGSEEIITDLAINQEERLTKRLRELAKKAKAQAAQPNAKL
ncbi:hypothetical protein MAP00_002543 [Monascus purpureus]|nr:hypothetical protein MAP00_002543 [Monascus purpureus]